MGVGQLSESDAVDALRLPFYSSSHPTGSHGWRNQFDLGNPDLRPEQFTEQAQEVLHNSQELVRRYHHSQWDVEHVLLALLELERGLPGQILSELGISAEAVKARLHQMLEAAPQSRW